MMRFGTIKNETIEFITRLLTAVLVCWVLALVLALLAGYFVGGVDCRNSDVIYLNGGGPRCASDNELLVRDVLLYGALALVLLSIVLPGILIRRRRAREVAGIPGDL